MKRLTHIPFCCVATVMMTCSVILLSMSGCRVLRPAQERVVHDTLRVERLVIERDTVLKTAPAAVADTFKVPCPELNLDIRKQSGNARLTVKIENGKGYAEAHCDTVALKARLKNYYENQYRSRSEQARITVTEQYVPTWVKFLAWSGVVLYLLIIWRIKKTISS